MLTCATLLPAQAEESELEQVEQELSSSNAHGSKRGMDSDDAAKKAASPLSRLLGALFSQVFLKAFTLTFLAEWGDRSQIATIGCGDGATRRGRAPCTRPRSGAADSAAVLRLLPALRRLAAQLDVVGVIIGSIVGHAACTGAAVLGGKHLAEHIDEKLVGVRRAGASTAVCACMPNV